MTEQATTTPLVRIDTFNHLSIYAKLENTNPSGTIKYRTISKILDDAIASGALRPEMSILEISSGNTGIALALRGKELGYPVTILTVKDATERSKELIRSYGAELVEVNGWFADANKKAEEMIDSKKDKWYRPNQIGNLSSRTSNFNLGLEIYEQFKAQFVGTIDFYIGSIATGSTISGVGLALKSKTPQTMVYQVLPYKEYDYPGVDSGENSTVPLPLFDKRVVDRKIMIKQEEAIEAARELDSKYGHYVGVSSGADFVAAKSIAKDHRGNCVIIFPDSGNRYPKILRKSS